MPRSVVTRHVLAHHQAPEGDGSEVRYYQLAENIWDLARGHAIAKVIYNFGRADQLDHDELRGLAASILRVVDGGTVAGCGYECFDDVVGPP